MRLSKRKRKKANRPGDEVTQNLRKWPLAVELGAAFGYTVAATGSRVRWACAFALAIAPRLGS